MKKHAIFCRERETQPYEVVLFDADDVSHALDQFRDEKENWSTPRMVMVEVTIAPARSDYDIDVVGDFYETVYSYRRVKPLASDLTDSDDYVAILPDDAQTHPGEFIGIYQWLPEQAQWLWRTDVQTREEAVAWIQQRNSLA